MKSYDNTDRLDDLIDQIDQTNVNKQKRGILLSLIILTILAFTTYLSFAQDKGQHPTSNVIKEADSDAKAQIISSSTTLENFNSPIHETSQNDDDGSNASKTPAVFLGEPRGVTQYLKDNILYPDDAFKNKVEGKVLVQITINEDGNVKNPTIVKGLGYGCDEEVVRVVSEMPNWQPAKVNQNPVKKSYILTVTFSLS